MRIDDFGAFLESGHAGLGEVAGVDGGQPRDFPLHVVAQRRPVERGRADRPAIAGRVREHLGEFGAVHQEFLGNTAADHAGAADAVFLGYHHAGAGLRGNASRAHTARSRADHEQVVVVFHGRILADTGPRLVVRKREVAMNKFKAFRIHDDGGKVSARFEDLALDELTPGEVVIDVQYSGINYKDALAATGAGRILRRYPLVGGIDLAGRVKSSDD